MIVSEPHLWWPEACKIAIMGVHSMEDSINLAKQFCSLVDPSLSLPDVPVDASGDVSSWIEREMDGMKSQISSLTDVQTLGAIEEEVDLFFQASFDLCEMWLKAALSCEKECRGIVSFVIDSISMLDSEKDRLMNRCPLTPARIEMYEKLHFLAFNKNKSEGLSIEDVDEVTSFIEAASDESCLRDLEDVGERVKRQMRLQTHVNDIVLHEHEKLSSSLRKGAKKKTDAIRSYHMKAASIAHDQLLSFLNQSRSDCAAKVMRARMSGDYKQESSSHISNLCVSMKKLCTMKVLYHIREHVRFIAESIHPKFKCNLTLQTEKEKGDIDRKSLSAITTDVMKEGENSVDRESSPTKYTNPYTPLSKKEEEYRKYIINYMSK